jgi:phenylacetate-CoA ligase
MLSSLWRAHWYVSKQIEFPGIHGLLLQLCKEGQLSLRDWRQLQSQRLRRALIHAQAHIPYYRELFQSIGFNPTTADLPTDLQKLPVLTKAEVRSHLDRLQMEGKTAVQVYENATGGSTGEPLKFYQDERYRTTAASLDAYVLSWWGINPYDKTGFVWGADREFHELSFNERVYEWRARRRGLNAFRMNDESLGQFCEMLREWKPPYLMGYSSALEAMARYVSTRGVKGVTCKAIRSSAEVLWPHQRRLIEETFQSPVYNFYGSREINNIAAECPEGRRLHCVSTWRYIEIVDSHGMPLPDGQVGHIVVTDLSNVYMPFIRYRNDDMGSLSSEPCSCGRSSPTIDQLMGRSSDLLRTKAGDLVHGEWVTHLFYGCDSIRRFQLHQTALDRITLKYVPIGQPPAGLLRSIQEKIRSRMGQDMTVDLEACDDIPVPTSGKYRFTLSSVPMP